MKTISKCRIGLIWRCQVVALGSLLLGMPLQAALIYETWSAYHHIAVIDSGGLRTLSFNGSAETRMSLANPLTGHFGYTEYFQMPLLFNTNASNVLMIGLGGGSAQRAYAHYHPQVKVETVEIDPDVVTVAKKYFGCQRTTNHNITVADGRMFLRHHNGKFDVIILDAYRAGRYGSDIPHHLATREFFKLAADHLTDNGVLAYNVIGTINGWRSHVLAAMHRTMKTVFPTIYLFPATDSQNVVILATKSKETVSQLKLRQRLDAIWKIGHRFPPNFPAQLNHCITNTPPGVLNAPVLSDDFCPPDGLIFGHGP